MRSIAIAAMLLTNAAAPPQPAPALDYSVPGMLIDVGGGRRINMLCAGSGNPTVLLIAGLGNSAVVWDQVQPRIALTTRVCAFDRAGFGFSDGSAHPQTTLERTQDIERALHAAHVDGPYVVVGHSLGSFESFVFADRNRRAVAGMVLVDPSIPDQVRRLFVRTPAAGAYALKGRMASLDSMARCAARVRAGALKPGAPDPDGCLHYPAYYPQALTARLTALDSRSRAATRLSLYRNGIDSADARTAPVVNPTRNYGAMPLIVLSSDPPFKAPADAPAAAVAEQPQVQAEWRKAHEEFAHLSTRGEHRIVPGSQHAIQRSNPDAVVAAVVEVVIAARATRR
jgi:pimeloyl-ACP methyl ester carboxylesterase